MGPRLIEAMKEVSFDMKGLSKNGKFTKEIEDAEIIETALGLLVECSNC